MRAVIQRRYGRPADVLELADVDPPPLADDTVRVRVHATSVHADVWHVVAGHPLLLRVMGAGLLRPEQPIPGTDLAGVVEAIGPAVTRFAVGDPVFGEVVDGFQWKNGGTFAELCSAPERTLAPMPPGLTFEQAAAVPTSALIALRTVRGDGGVRAGHRVAVNGAGGALGTCVVQLARALGAEVTAIDLGEKHDLLRRLGAAHVVDYTQSDFTALDGAPPYDAIIDVASVLTIAQFRRALTPEGRYVYIGHDHYGARRGRVLGNIPHMLKLGIAGRFVGHIPPMNYEPAVQGPLATLAEMLTRGEIEPVVDRVYPLDAVHDAMRHLVDGRPRGRVGLSVTPTSSETP